MEQHDKYIKESMKVFRLIREDMSASLELLKEDSEKASRLAFRAAILDLASFIDEYKHLKGYLYLSPDRNLKIGNRFLLLTHNSMKTIFAAEKGIRKMRNGIYAHNYRNNNGKFQDPLILVMQNYHSFPVLEKEVKLHLKIAIAVIDISYRCFFENETRAFVELRDVWFKFTKLFPEITSKEMSDPDRYYDELQGDIMAIRNALDAHDDNYAIVARKIKCKIR